MSKNFKDLLQEIQKLASPPPPAPPGYGHSSNLPPSPVAGSPISTPTGQFSGQRGNPQIKNMQEALIALAKDVTSQLNLGALQKQEAEGRDSFGDFITKHFLRNSDIPAVEFSPDQSKTQMSDKDPRSPSKLNWVMDTMQRIGNTKSESFADGVWGPRTNAALQNVYAMAYGLLKLAETFNIKPESYNNQFLDYMKTGIPEDISDFSPIQKIEAAGKITKHINAIRKMYQEIKNSILEKPQYRAYIENDKPYLHHDKGVYFTPQQINSMKQSFANGFVIPLQNKGSSAKITVDNLLSVDALQKWIAQFPEDKLDPQFVLNNIMNQISQPNQGA